MKWKLRLEISYGAQIEWVGIMQIANGLNLKGLIFFNHTIIQTSYIVYTFYLQNTKMNNENLHGLVHLRTKNFNLHKVMLVDICIYLRP